MIGKEQDIILCTILQPGIYFQPLRYIVSTLNVSWHTVTVAGGAVAQDTVLASVSTKSNEWSLHPVDGDRLSWLPLERMVSPLKEPISTDRF